MKIRADRTALADALTWVSQAISKKPMNVALSGVRITTAGDHIQLSAYDYEISHEARVLADVGGEGECLVSAAFVRSIVASMRAKDVELVLDDDVLTISSGKAAYTTRTLKIEDYPALPPSPSKVGIIDAGDLLAGLGVVMHPIDGGSPHEQVRGLRIEAAEYLELVGMDRFRLATVALPWEGKPVAVTVPAKGFHAAAKGLNGTVTLGVAEGSVGLFDDERRVTLRVYGPGYTDKWRTLVAPAAEGEPSAVLECADLESAVKRAGTLTDLETSITVTLHEGEVVIDVDAHEAGAGSDVLDAEVTGEASGDLHSDYLAAALAAVPSGRVRLIRPKRQGPWQIQALDHPHIRLCIMGKKAKS